MPELPEVETVVRDLRPLLVGRRFEAVRAGKRKLRRAWSAAWEPHIVGRTVQGVRRRGKWIVLELEGGGLLVVHLGMTGQLTVRPPTEAVQDHTHLIFDLDNGQQLRFRDVRRFGSATYYANAEELNTFLDGKLGPEPFELPADYWRDALRKTNRPLKAVLLDQRVVAGVGNIYADESLHAARLNPKRTGRQTTRAQAERLREAIVAVLNRAIELRGSSIRDYVGGSGLKGGFQETFSVYGRAGDPCPTCGRPIACVRLAGRSTHYCPKCQKA